MGSTRISRNIFHCSRFRSSVVFSYKFWTFGCHTSGKSLLLVKWLRSLNCFFIVFAEFWKVYNYVFSKQFLLTYDYFLILIYLLPLFFLIVKIHKLLRSFNIAECVSLVHLGLHIVHLVRFGEETLVFKLVTHFRSKISSCSCASTATVLSSILILFFFSLQGGNFHAC